MRFLLSACLLLTSFWSTASLLVTPSRLAFSETDRTQEVILVNSSSEPRSYRLEWINMRQDENAQYIDLSGDELNNFPRADKFFRFSPRRVTLQGGESQKIKVMVRRGRGMTEPEYRSHLRFTALPKDLVSAPAQDEAVEGVQMKLNLMLSYSIPVVLRTKPAKLDVTISDMQLNTAEQKVSFVLNKGAPNSVFGNFTVMHESNGVSQDIGYLNNHSMFAEVGRQNVSVNFIKPIPANTGKLKVVYKGKQEFSDITLGTAEISL